jgi:hypothetical protein
MTLEAISDLSQTIAALAVVASLIYGVLQFRIYNKATQEARYSAAISDIQEFRKILAADADCARIYRDGLADLSKLDAIERWRFGALMQMVTTYFSTAIRFGDVMEIEHLKAGVEMTMHRPGARQWWEKGGKLTLDGATRETFEQLMATRGSFQETTELTR